MAMVPDSGPCLHVSSSAPHPSHLHLTSHTVFGYPHSNGKLLSNYYHYILNNHPLLSMLFRHPKNVYTRSQRLVVYLNALFFAVFVSFVLLGTTTVKQVSC